MLLHFLGEFLIMEERRVDGYDRCKTLQGSCTLYTLHLEEFYSWRSERFGNTVILISRWVSVATLLAMTWSQVGREHIALQVIAALFLIISWQRSLEMNKVQEEQWKIPGWLIPSGQPQGCCSLLSPSGTCRLTVLARWRCVQLLWYSKMFACWIHVGRRHLQVCVGGRQSNHPIAAVICTVWCIGSVQTFEDDSSLHKWGGAVIWAENHEFWANARKHK